MGRAPCCDKANVKRGPWSPEEDAALKSYLERYGTGGNWIALPQKAGLKRCGKSCRLRWLNYLRPDIKHGGFTEEEDNIICNLYKSIGSRWSIIASKLPGRTDNDVKNYWNTKLKKKLMAGHTSLPAASNTHIYQSLSPPTFMQVPKAEAQDHFNMPLERAMDSGFCFSTAGSVTELMPYTMLGAPLMEDFSGSSIGHAMSPPEDFSAASSSVTVDNSCASNNNYFNWSGGDDGFLIEPGFGSFSDLLTGGYDSHQEKMSEGAPCYAPHGSILPGFWASFETTKPFHSIPYS